jgi:hypothetical protein
VKRQDRAPVPSVPGQPDRGDVGAGRTVRGPGVSRGLPGQGGPASSGRGLGEPPIGRSPLHPADRDRDKGRPGKDGRPNRTPGSGRSR